MDDKWQPWFAIVINFQYHIALSGQYMLLNFADANLVYNFLHVKGLISFIFHRDHIHHWIQSLDPLLSQQLYTKMI